MGAASPPRAEFVYRRLSTPSCEPVGVVSRAAQSQVPPAAAATDGAGKRKILKLSVVSGALLPGELFRRAPSPRLVRKTTRAKEKTAKNKKVEQSHWK